MVAPALVFEDDISFGATATNPLTHQWTGLSGNAGDLLTVYVFWCDQTAPTTSTCSGVTDSVGNTYWPVETFSFNASSNLPSGYSDWRCAIFVARSKAAFSTITFTATFSKAVYFGILNWDEWSSCDTIASVVSSTNIKAASNTLAFTTLAADANAALRAYMYGRDDAGTGINTTFTQAPFTIIDFTDDGNQINQSYVASAAGTYTAKAEAGASATDDSWLCTGWAAYQAPDFPVVQHTTGNAAGSGNLSFASNVAAGHAVVVWIGSQGTAPVSAVVDDAGNRYTLATSDTFGTNTVACYVCSPVAGTPKKISWTFGGGSVGNVQVSILEIGVQVKPDQVASQEMTAGNQASTGTTAALSVPSELALAHVYVPGYPTGSSGAVTNGFTPQGINDATLKTPWSSPMNTTFTILAGATAIASMVTFQPGTVIPPPPANASDAMFFGTDV
jgi:hypothetical protein